MTPEQIHRKKLKELGYKDEVIESLVLKYIINCTYEFAEAYHKEKQLETLKKAKLWKKHLKAMKL